ncbi:UNVERIFIED_CONTAM: hypothetical protein Slati_1226500 [Sesamum latifolium]|uniref:Uncharacterized protein n=1 Tax=Sesamum latifolium TaxID=2727402 RepID=A0AAW2XF50_9LAMI
MEANWESNAKGSSGVRKIMSPCDVEALKKCLEENKGDQKNVNHKSKLSESHAPLRNRTHHRIKLDNFNLEV